MNLIFVGSSLLVFALRILPVFTHEKAEKEPPLLIWFSTHAYLAKPGVVSALDFNNQWQVRKAFLDIPGFEPIFKDAMFESGQ